ncbi:octopamine receptor beta-2R-like [Argopecten irradians]|uniref:octopamine receptor beta-2R-like n=1 Tax=Argopecten irradians TaxID=31199 RepID=UPI003722A578
MEVDMHNTSQNGTLIPEEGPPGDGIVLLVIKTTVMVAVMLSAVLGNFLVIMSVIRFEKLRATVTNYFILSLAAADLLVAVVVMPFNASMEITDKWIFGRTMCDIFNSNDVLFSTASILHLCCISVDRYIAIMNPLHYETKLTKRRVALMIAVTWISSLLISYIPIHSQFYTTDENLQELSVNPDSCKFVVNRIYAVVSSSVSFWVPCTIMVFVYFRIFKEARKQEKYIRSASVCSSELTGNGDLLIPGNTKNSRDITERKRLKREHKAAKTLGIIMGGFILCFFPFFSWYLITSLCREKCQYPPLLGTILFWVGYFNSCLNPVIYAYCNREFRQAFKKLLNWAHCSDFNQNSTYCTRKRSTNSSPNNSKNDEYVQMVYVKKECNICGTNV